MSITAQKIYPNGLYQVNGNFDETTFNAGSGVITNTVAYSQNFTASGISTSGVFVSLTTATVAPDGTYTAWKLTKAFTTVSSQAWLNVPTGVSGRYQSVYSVYVKPAEYSTFAFSYNTAGWVAFNLTLTQVVSVSTGSIVGSGSGGFVSGSITTASNGWYRLSATTINESISPMQLAILNSGFIGTNTDGVYIWGIQSEVSSAGSPSIYVPKVNNVIASPPGVKTVAPGNVYTSGVLDEVTYNTQSGVVKNLLGYSQDFTQAAYWSGAGNGVTYTTSTVLGPDNLTYATLATITTTYNATRQSVSVTPNTQYTFSFFALRGTASNLVYSIYDITNSANISAGVSYYNQTNASLWSRIVVPFTTPAGCVSVGVYPERDNGASGTVYLWGAQLELGSTATIYQGTTLPNTLVETPFVSRADSSGNLYNPNYFDEVASTFTWTFTASTVGYGSTGWQGIQSKFTGGLADSNYFDTSSFWGSVKEDYASITAVFPTTYNISNVYLGPVDAAASGGWAPFYSNGDLQCSTDNTNWYTLTNATFTTPGLTRVFAVNTATKYIRLKSLNTSNWLAVSEFYFDVKY